MPKNSNRTILVTGATGQQGGAALRHLRDCGFPVRALTRNPNGEKARHLVGHGTEVVRGDLNDAASITRALDGVYGVYSVETRGEDGVEGEVRQGIQLIDAAKRSRITHFVQSSVAGADQNTGIPHFESKNKIEQHLRATGLHFTIFRPVWFMENLLAMRDRIDGGEIALPARPETRLPMIAVDDIGSFVAMAFEKPGHWQDQTREIAGDEMTLAEMADRLGRAAGREVRYRQVPWDEWEQKHGPDMTKMWRWFDEAGPHVDTSLIRQEYPQLTGFDRWLSTHWTLRRTA